MSVQAEQWPQRVRLNQVVRALFTALGGATNHLTGSLRGVGVLVTAIATGNALAVGLWLSGAGGAQMPAGGDLWALMVAKARFPLLIAALWLLVGGGTIALVEWVWHRRLRRLAAWAAARAPLGGPLPRAHVDEFDSLAAALEMAQDLLQTARERRHKQRFLAERDRGPRDWAIAVACENAPPTETIIADVWLAAGLAGGGGGAFFGVGERGVGGFAFVGNVGGGDALKRGVEAEAARLLAAAHLAAGRSPRAVWPLLTALFHLDTWTCAVWEGGGKAATRWHFEARIEGEPACEPVGEPLNGTCLLATSGRDSDRHTRLETYVSRMADLGPGGLLEDLQQLVAPGEAGATVVLAFSALEEG